MAARMHKAPKPRIKAPATHNDWHKLMVAAIQQAEKVQDKRANSLRLALAQNKAEQQLRKMHIICPADILRVFPEPQK